METKAFPKKNSFYLSIFSRQTAIRIDTESSPKHHLAYFSCCLFNFFLLFQKESYLELGDANIVKIRFDVDYIYRLIENVNPTKASGN